MKEEKVIAAFDFDGTITYRDTFISFLWHTTPAVRFFWNCFTLIPALLLFCLRIYGRQKLKERFIARFFKALPIETLHRWGRDFAGEPLEALIKPEALKRIRWHQKLGHTCILVSASLDVYLQPWSQIHSFHEPVCSRLQIDPNQCVTGKLMGANCRGAEKVSRLEEVLGPLHQYQIYAYGDSAGDRELLERADWAFYREMPIDEF